MCYIDLYIESERELEIQKGTNIYRHTYINAHMHTYLHTYTQTYIHTDMHTFCLSI